MHHANVTLVFWGSRVVVLLVFADTLHAQNCVFQFKLDLTRKRKTLFLFSVSTMNFHSMTSDVYSHPSLSLPSCPWLLLYMLEVNLLLQLLLLRWRHAAMWMRLRMSLKGNSKILISPVICVLSIPFHCFRQTLREVDLLRPPKGFQGLGERCNKGRP